MTNRITVKKTSIQNFAGLHLSTGPISLTIIPELGGKLSSLRDERTGREWLWTNPHLPYKKLPYGVSYVQEADTGGWDECFPSVAVSAYPPQPGVTIPDHGEIWSQSWPLEVLGEPETELRLRTRAQGVALPYLFERTITLRPGEDRVRFDYRVENLAESELAFIWSSHPLFAIEPGMRLLLPTGAQMHPWLTIPETLLSTEQIYSWPISVNHMGQTWDLSTLPGPEAKFGCKIWSEPLNEGYAALVASDGEFRFTFDSTILPQIGVWLNAGAWSGTNGTPYYNLALEPCIGAQDSLAEAIERYGQYTPIPSYGSREWWLEAKLSIH